MKSLAQIASKRGLTVEERGPGHFQIIGGTCLVNYYPDSKRKVRVVLPFVPVMPTTTIREAGLP